MQPLLTMLNWLGNAALALAFVGVLATAGQDDGAVASQAPRLPVDAEVLQPEPAFAPQRPPPSVREYSPPRPTPVSVRTGSRSYSGSSRSFGGGGFRFGK